MDELVASFTKSRSDFMALAQLSMLKTNHKEDAPSTTQANQVISSESKKKFSTNSEKVVEKMKEGRSSTQVSGVYYKKDRKRGGKPEEAELGAQVPLMDKKLEGVKSEVTEQEFSEDVYCVPKPPVCSEDFDFFSEFSAKDPSATPPLASIQPQVASPATPPLWRTPKTPLGKDRPRKRVLQFEERQNLQKTPVNLQSNNYREAIDNVSSSQVDSGRITQATQVDGSSISRVDGGNISRVDGSKVCSSKVDSEIVNIEESVPHDNENITPPLKENRKEEKTESKDVKRGPGNERNNLTTQSTDGKFGLIWCGVVHACVYVCTHVVGWVWPRGAVVGMSLPV